MKNILLSAIVIMAIAMFTVPSLAETQDECIARCKGATEGRAFGHIAYRDCVDRYCYKTIKSQESAASCDSLIKVIIRARLTWLDTGEVNDLMVDRILSGGGQLAQLIRYYFSTGSVVTLAKLKDICEAAQSQR
jgi:hypothetical protein